MKENSDPFLQSRKKYNLPLFYYNATIKKTGLINNYIKLVSILFYETDEYPVCSSYKPITKLIKYH